MSATIIMLAQESDHANITFNQLSREFDISKVIFESPEPRGRFVKRRIRRMGIFTVAGQIMFQLFIVPFLRHESSERIKAICDENEMYTAPVPEDRVIRVKSINSKKTRRIIEELSPAIIVVVGTRIISRKLLQAIPATFINIHCGITPLYRGAHGGYWALVEKDLKNCGVTVHHVDPGIDTGGILHQATIEPTAEDNYYTYPYLQFAAGVPLIGQAIRAAQAGNLQTTAAPAGESRMWSHPTALSYLLGRARGVK